MNIGIVTVQDVCNFGSFLQAYALQKLLQDMGHTVYFIRSSEKKYCRGLFYRIRPYGKEWKQLGSFIVKNAHGWYKHRVFLKAQKCFNVLEKYDDQFLDIVILGSDEIWNAKNSLFHSPIFYGQGMKRVMAFAVSIGDADSQDMNAIPDSYFFDITSISSRDFRTKEFLRQRGIETELVCDPTLLVDKTEFKKDYHHKLMDGMPYILLYAYGHEISNDMKSEIRKFANKNNLRLISVCFKLDWCDGTINCSPMEFCSVLEKATYVITATFHGAIFSVLNHKNFICMPQSPKTVAVLESFGLENRILLKNQFTTGNLSRVFLRGSIDYFEVERKIEAQRQHAIKVLEMGMEEIIASYAINKE